MKATSRLVEGVYQGNHHFCIICGGSGHLYAICPHGAGGLGPIGGGHPPPPSPPPPFPPPPPPPPSPTVQHHAGIGGSGGSGGGPAVMPLLLPHQYVNGGVGHSGQHVVLGSGVSGVMGQISMNGACPEIFVEDSKLVPRRTIAQQEMPNWGSVPMDCSPQIIDKSTSLRGFPAFPKRLSYHSDRRPNLHRMMPRKSASIFHSSQPSSSEPEHISHQVLGTGGVSQAMLTAFSSSRRAPSFSGPATWSAGWPRFSWGQQAVPVPIQPLGIPSNAAPALIGSSLAPEKWLLEGGGSSGLVTRPATDLPVWMGINNNLGGGSSEAGPATLTAAVEDSRVILGDGGGSRKACPATLTVAAGDGRDFESGVEGRPEEPLGERGFFMSDSAQSRVARQLMSGSRLGKAVQVDGGLVGAGRSWMPGGGVGSASIANGGSSGRSLGVKGPDSRRLGMMARIPVGREVEAEALVWKHSSLPQNQSLGIREMPAREDDPLLISEGEVGKLGDGIPVPKDVHLLLDDREVGKEGDGTVGSLDVITAGLSAYAGQTEIPLRPGFRMTAPDFELDLNSSPEEESPSVYCPSPQSDSSSKSASSRPTSSPLGKRGGGLLEEESSFRKRSRLHPSASFPSQDVSEALAVGSRQCTLSDLVDQGPRLHTMSGISAGAELRAAVEVVQRALSDLLQGTVPSGFSDPSNLHLGQQLPANRPFLIYPLGQDPLWADGIHTVSFPPVPPIWGQGDVARRSSTREDGSSENRSTVEIPSKKPKTASSGRLAPHTSE